MNSDLPHLIGHPICPYVQRVLIVMKEKKIAFERKDIDLENKPDWLKALSPTGKVPILILSTGQVLFESSVITDYLDSAYPHPLHPIDPVHKALHRAWIEFGADILRSVADIIYRDKTLDHFQTSMHKISKSFAILENKISGPPYFYGSTFHLIDAVYGTIFRYFKTLTPLSPIDPFQDLDKIKVWKKTLEARPSIQHAVPSNYADLLKELIAKNQSYAGRQLSRP